MSSSATSSPVKTRSASASPTKNAASSPKKTPGSPAKSPARQTRSSAKKESFKWNTPADEFADDVASDAEEDVEFEDNRGGGLDEDDLSKATPVEAEIDGERFQAHRTPDGDIIIQLGVEEAERFSVQGATVKVVKKGEGSGRKRKANDDILGSLDDYKLKVKDDLDESRSGAKTKSKTRFQCPKCEKIWNWPWELRRHVLTHYKEVSY